MSTTISLPWLRKCHLFCLSVCWQESGRGEKNGYFSTAGLAPSLGLRLGARMAQLGRAAHANVTTPLLQEAVISHPRWTAAPGCAAGNLQSPSVPHPRGARLFLEQHWWALTQPTGLVLETALFFSAAWASPQAKACQRGISDLGRLPSASLWSTLGYPLPPLYYRQLVDLKDNASLLYKSSLRHN